MLIINMDDIVLAGNNTDEMEKQKWKVAYKFEIKDLEALRYSLK